MCEKELCVEMGGGVGVGVAPGVWCALDDAGDSSLDENDLRRRGRNDDIVFG